MVWARRENQISHLLAGLSNQEPGVRDQATRTLLLAYFQQHNKLPLQEASDQLDACDGAAISSLTESLLKLANAYQWE